MNYGYRIFDYTAIFLFVLCLHGLPWTSSNNCVTNTKDFSCHSKDSKVTNLETEKENLKTSENVYKLKKILLALKNLLFVLAFQKSQEQLVSSLGLPQLHLRVHWAPVSLHDNTDLDHR